MKKSSVGFPGVDFLREKIVCDIPDVLIGRVTCAFNPDAEIFALTSLSKILKVWEHPSKYVLCIENIVHIEIAQK